MAKSKGNFITLQTIIDEGFKPLDFRYLTLTAHYRTKLEFTPESLQASAQARKKLTRQIQELPDGGSIQKDFVQVFTEAINDDLNMPEALALVWKVLKDESVSPADKKATILEFDKVLGLELDKVETVNIPEHIKQLAQAREEARKNKDWAESDRLRDEIQQAGFTVKDTQDGPEILPL